MMMMVVMNLTWALHCRVRLGRCYSNILEFLSV